MEARHAKQIVWLGRTREFVKELGVAARRDIGFALFQAECGDTPVRAKSMKGFPGVMEIRVWDAQNRTYRIVYTAKFETGVFVLHAFQKKSAKGISTPKRELDIIRERLKFAQGWEKGK